MLSSVINVVDGLGRQLTSQLLLCTALIISLVVLTAHPVHAQTTIQVLNCDGMTGSTLTILDPQSDSTVSDSPISISGTVNQANQIEVYDNNTLAHIIPLAFGATEFSTSLSLSPGTHSIRMVALDLCQIDSAEDETIVTYEPAVVPGNGAGIPTDIAENQPNTPPVAVVVPQTPAGQIVDTLILQPLKRIGDFLDVSAPLAENDAATIPNSQRFVLGSTGAAMIVASPAISNGVVQVAQRLVPQFTAAPRRIRITKNIFVTLGSILIVLMFTL